MGFIHQHFNISYYVLLYFTGSRLHTAFLLSLFLTQIYNGCSKGTPVHLLSTQKFVCSHVLVFLCTVCCNLVWKILTAACIFELLVTFKSVQEIFYICVIKYIWNNKKKDTSTAVPVVDLECAQFLIYVHWYFVSCAYSFYLLVHRYNEELCHQEIARVRDVVVFETRVLSSILPWCTLLWPFLYSISSSILNMLNVCEETGNLGCDEYWQFLWFYWCFQPQCFMNVIPTVFEGFLYYRSWQNIGFFICYNIRVYSLFVHVLINSQFITVLWLLSTHSWLWYQQLN